MSEVGRQTFEVGKNKSLGYPGIGAGRMPIRSYHDMEVYREGFDLALRVHRETECFPVEERYGTQSQIRRSSKSVCAVIAEGFGRIDSEAEFRRYLMIEKWKRYD